MSSDFFAPSCLVLVRFGFEATERSRTLLRLKGLHINKSF